MDEFLESTFNKEHVCETIITLEKRALELWNNGNADGFIALSSNDVIYIDPALENKLESKKALEEYYNTIRGKVKIDLCKVGSHLKESWICRKLISINKN